MIQTLVILGASGDLTSRFLMPAIARLDQAGKFPKEFRVLGVAQDDWNTERFRSHLEQKLAAPDIAGVARTREAILGRVDYRRVDVTDRDQLAQALGKVTDPLVAYLALPPGLFARRSNRWRRLNCPRAARWCWKSPSGRVWNRRRR
jgi:glucose-6-phosphate 1-dehydrogenase